MGKLLERNTELARRCRDLSPLREPIKARLLEGNRAVIMAGVSPGTTRPVPLTWRQQNAGNRWVKRPGQRPFKMIGYAEAGRGPARAPKGVASRVVAGCEVSVRAGVGQLSYTKSWPSLGDVAGYLEHGTRYMPARPFMGYRQIDLEFIRGLMRDYVIKPGFFSRLFGRG